RSYLNRLNLHLYLRSILYESIQHERLLSKGPFCCTCFFRSLPHGYERLLHLLRRRNSSLYIPYFLSGVKGNIPIGSSADKQQGLVCFSPYTAPNNGIPFFRSRVLEFGQV